MLSETPLGHHITFRTSFVTLFGTPFGTQLRRHLERHLRRYSGRHSRLQFSLTQFAKTFGTQFGTLRRFSVVTKRFIILPNPFQPSLTQYQRFCSYTFTFIFRNGLQMSVIGYNYCTITHNALLYGQRLHNVFSDNGLWCRLPFITNDTFANITEDCCYCSSYNKTFFSYTQGSNIIMNKDEIKFDETKWTVSVP